MLSLRFLVCFSTKTKLFFNTKFFDMDPVLAGEDVVFVANDWHSALVSCYLKSVYQPNGVYKSAKVLWLRHLVPRISDLPWDSALLTILLGCVLHSQHCLPREICVFGLLSSKSSRPTQKLF